MKDGLRAHCRTCGEKPPSRQQCKHCGSEWDRKGRGPVPPLCPTCVATLSWCPECAQALEHAAFYATKRARTGCSYRCKACHVIRMQTDGGIRSRRDSHLVRTYGITLDEYEARVQGQGGMCACCGRGLGIKPVVDHDHETGKVRGIVCYGCNTGLGKIGDNPDGAHRAEMYMWQTRDVLSEVAEGKHYWRELIDA